MVLLCLVAFFAVVAGVNAVMMTAAISTFGGVETASAYKAGLAFARESSTARAQDALSWQVGAHVRASGPDIMVVEVVVRDAAGRPLTGLAAKGWLAHPADRRADLALTLHEAQAGTFRATTVVTHGQRDLVIELWRNGVRHFRSRNRMTLP